MRASPPRLIRHDVLLKSNGVYTGTPANVLIDDLGVFIGNNSLFPPLSIQGRDPFDMLASVSTPGATPTFSPSD